MKAVTAEALGVFALVLAGGGAIATGASGLGVAASFGLAIMAMVYAVGHVSGAHLNPAVTLAFALTRHFAWSRVVPYWLGQGTGAIAAAGFLRLTLGTDPDIGVVRSSVALVPALAWEIALTGILMFVVTAVATDNRAVGQAAAIAIGGTVAVAALVGGPVSGAALNPARALGPALVSGTLDGLWIYLLGPPVGAVGGALAYRFVRGEASLAPIIATPAAGVPSLPTAPAARPRPGSARRPAD